MEEKENLRARLKEHLWLYFFSLNWKMLFYCKPLEPDSEKASWTNDVILIVSVETFLFLLWHYWLLNYKDKMSEIIHKESIQCFYKA